MTTVLQIIPSLGPGGAEQSCIDVSAGLVAAGHRSIIVSSGGSRVAEAESAGAEHITHPVDSKNPLSILANARWLAQLALDERVDVIHARSRAPAWSGYWASGMAGCAFMTTFHAAYKFSSPLKKFYNSVMAKGDRIIAISHFIAAHIADTYGVGPERVRVIPRCVDLEKFASELVTPERQNALRAAWGIEGSAAENRPLILMPSRVSPIKGQTVLIEAMGLLSPQFHNATAVILGDDQGRTEYRASLEKMVAERNLQERVKFAQHCADMPAAYNLAALAVAPSLVPEGFGRVPVEAMAMGVPVVTTRLGGLAETVTPGETGWLVNPGDPQELADAIMQALSLPSAQRTIMAENGIRLVRAHYDKRKMVADTLAVYAELAK